MFVQITLVLVFILLAGVGAVLWARSARKKAQLGLLKGEASDTTVTTYLCPVCHSRVPREEWSFRSMMCLGCAQQSQNLSHAEENVQPSDIS